MRENRFVATALLLTLFCVPCHAWTAGSKSNQDAKKDAQEKDPKLAGTMQIVVGQGDLITLKEDLPDDAEIKVVNPAIADFVPIDKRRIRIIAKKAGWTELTVKTKANNIFRYQVEAISPKDRANIRNPKKFTEILEIVAGQQRLLTMKKGLTVVRKPDMPDLPETLIALGEDSIADFRVVNTRHIIVIAKKAGLTDLMIIASDGAVLHYEINVVASKDRAKIRKAQKFDEIIELPAGQERSLNFKTDLISKPGESLIALGDRSIADFKPLDKRRIQVIAKKPGLAELLIIFGNGEVLHYEIKVTPPPKK